MAKQTTFTITLIVTLALGVLILAIGIFVWHQQNVELTRLEAERKKFSSRIREIKKQTDQRDDYTEDLSKLLAELRTIDNDLVEYRYIPTYLVQLRKAAIDTGNTIQSIQPDEVRPLDMQDGPLSGEEQVEAVKKVVVRKTAAERTRKRRGEIESDYRVQKIILEVNGSYVSVLQLLKRLRDFPKLVYVREVTIAPLKREIGSKDTISAKLVTYAIITPEQYKAPETDVTSSAPETGPTAAMAGEGKRVP